jgi:hypothetical protein
MIVPLRIRRSIAILLPLSLVGIGLGTYLLSSPISPTIIETLKIKSSKPVEEFSPAKAYKLDYMVTTGPSDYIILPEGEVALEYDKENSDKMALGSFMGLSHEVLERSNAEIILVGELATKTHTGGLLPPGQHGADPWKERTFRLKHWYIEKFPFTQDQNPDSAQLLGTEKESLKHVKRTTLERSDFVERIDKSKNDFSPNAPAFNPHLYEKPLPR